MYYNTILMGREQMLFINDANYSLWITSQCMGFNFNKLLIPGGPLDATDIRLFARIPL